MSGYGVNQEFAKKTRLSGYVFVSKNLTAEAHTVFANLNLRFNLRCSYIKSD